MSRAIQVEPQFEVLRERVDRLEREMEAIRKQLTGSPPDTDAPPDDTRGARVQFSDKAEIRAVMQEVMRELGISEDPGISPKDLRRRMIRNGVKPEDCLASRAIIRMRGESP